MFAVQEMVPLLGTSSMPRETLIAGKATASQTKQELFRMLRDQHATSVGSPNYRAMAAAFHVAFVKQVYLVQLQVRVRALPCNFALYTDAQSAM